MRPTRWGLLANSRPQRHHPWAVKLEKALGSTADTWLRMQMSHDLAKVREREASLTVRRLVRAFSVWL